MKIHVQSKGHDSCISWSITLNTATQTHTQIMLEDNVWSQKSSVPVGKCQDWDCLLSLCPARCACSTVTRPRGEIITFLCSYSFWIFFSVFGMWPQAYRRHCPDPCLNAKLLISWCFFPEALILPQFECFRQYADLKEKTSVSQGHSKCIGSFLRQKMTQTYLSKSFRNTHSQMCH